MKNKIINSAGIIVIILILVLIPACLFTSCRQANRVSENLSKEADNFNIVRQITVINCIKGREDLDSCLVREKVKTLTIYVGVKDK